MIGGSTTVKVGAGKERANSEKNTMNSIGSGAGGKQSSNPICKNTNIIYIYRIC